MRIQWTIRRRLLSLVISVSLPLIAMILLNGTAEVLDARQRTQAQSLQLARAIARQIDLLLEDSQSLLAGLSGEQRLRSLDPAKCGDLFQAFRPALTRYANTIVADPVGQVRCSAIGGAGASPSVGQRAWFAQARQSDQPVIGSVESDPATRRNVVVIAQAMRQVDGGLIGIVGLELDIARLQAVARIDLLQSQEVLTLLDRNGVVIIRSAELDRWIGQSVSNVPLVQQVTGSTEGAAVMADLDGVARLHGYVTTSVTDWHVLVSAPLDIAYTQITNVVVRNALLAIVVVIVALLMARLIMRRIEPPLQALIDGARAVSAGNDDVTIAPAPDRDLADLATAFNQMVARRKEAMAQLEQAAERYRELFENSRDALFVIDLEGRTVSANAAAVKLTGYRLDELRQTRALDLMPIDARESEQERLRRYRQAHGLREMILVTRDGRKVPIEVAVTPITYQGEIALLGAARDIAERRHAEERLVRLSQRILTLNEAGLRMQETFDPNAILEIVGDELRLQRFDCMLLSLNDDLQSAHVQYVSNPDWDVVFRQASGSRLMGFTLPVGGPAMQRVVAQQQTLMVDDVRSVLEAGLPPDSRPAVRQALARLKLTRAIFTPLVTGRRATAILIVAGHDLQEVDTPAIAAFARQVGVTLENARLYAEATQKTAEVAALNERIRAHAEELEQRVAERTRDLEIALVKVKEADKLKSQLLSTVSHELRTPLASIKGYATTLIDYRDRLPDATQAEFLHIIDSESDRLRELVENLLDMSRIEAGVLRIHPEPARLASVVGQALTQLQPKLAGREVQVDLPDALPDVMIDAGRIQQVLANLIDNAAKYSPAGSPILISVTAQAAGVTVGVHDHGPGISSEHAQKIFDRFYRIDDARIRNTGGIGLGLAISHALVEAHGGRLWLDSVPGQGSTFYFSVPIVQPQADTPIEPGVEAVESIGAN